MLTDADKALRKLMERSYVDGVCRIWEGPPRKDGYGQVRAFGKVMSVHRAAWVARNGPIPPGLEVLHRCDRPLCFGESCLFTGTHAENMADRSAKGRTTRHNSLKTHCPYDHPYDEANTLWTFVKATGGWHRQCRACKVKSNAAGSAARRAAKLLER